MSFFVLYIYAQSISYRTRYIYSNNDISTTHIYNGQHSMKAVKLGGRDSYWCNTVSSVASKYKYILRFVLLFYVTEERFTTLPIYE